jgi:hypothetical protein
MYLLLSPTDNNLNFISIFIPHFNYMYYIVIKNDLLQEYKMYILFSLQFL